jgi:hypothetical protein
MESDSLAREECARQKQRVQDIRAVLEDIEAGRRAVRGGLSLIAELALGEADRTVRVGINHAVEVRT